MTSSTGTAHSLGGDHPTSHMWGFDTETTPAPSRRLGSSMWGFDDLPQPSHQPLTSPNLPSTTHASYPPPPLKSGSFIEPIPPPDPPLRQDSYNAIIPNASFDAVTVNKGKQLFSSPAPENYPSTPRRIADMMEVSSAPFFVAPNRYLTPASAMLSSTRSVTRPGMGKPVIVADIVFLMDITGSMQKFIDNARLTMMEIMRTVSEEIHGFTPRVGFVGYRDYEDTQRFAVLDFTDNIDHVVEFIGNIVANGGGDFPEDVKGGLCEMLKLRWSSRHKILVHVADAPAHGLQFHDGRHRDRHQDGGIGEKTMEDILREMTERGIIYNFIRLNNSCDIMVREFSTILSRYNRGRPVRVTELGDSADTTLFTSMMASSISGSMRAR
ncbi:hypothetical protein BC829DRAFT_254940 [Chytridium lagenaria]|nr:hypothetical protein BC829DRAFT_254940 [Chytridium lagenaria]